jgi:hypothetical protein
MSWGEQIAAELRQSSAAITYTNEDDLQAALAAIFDVTPEWRAQREVRLSDGISRIDLVIKPDILGLIIDARTGIEVKIDGSLASVIRQLDRYAACPEIDELILVTTRAKHHHIPRTLGARGIPVHLVSLIENGL